MWDAWLDPTVASVLIQEAPDMIVTFDDAGRFAQANPATLRQSGYSIEELRALPLSAFFPAPDLARLIAVRERATPGEQPAIRVRFHRKDGELRWLSVRTAPLQRDGVPAGLLVMAHDVTDEVSRTQALRRSDERFRSLVAAFDRAFFVVDPDLRIAGVFGRWVHSAGLEPRQFLGRTPAELFPDVGGEPHMSALTRVLAGEDVTYEFDYDLPNGTRSRLRVSGSPMRGADGSVIGVAGVAADITRRLAAEAESAKLRERVAEADRTESLGKLVSGVAHELNNPLAAVLNFVEDLLQTEVDPDRHSALEIVRAQALRARVIVSDLLTFARRGGHRPRTPQAPGPILETVVRALRPGLSRGTVLEAQIADGQTVLEMDRAGFEQVVTNLIANAAQAARHAGRISLEARREGAEYVIAVTDDGPGMPPEVLARLFEPFFTTKPAGQGVGLGLAVSQGIVHEHGGTLLADNVPGSGGARFTVRLPVSAKPLPMVTPPIGITAVSRSTRSPTDDSPVLLIIDDEEPVRRALARYFERRGWRVEEAGDGLEGQELLWAPRAANHYVAVLCDLRMPGLDGMTLYERIRDERPELLPRIVISTGDVSGRGIAGFLAGVRSPILEKPFELATVEAVLERLRDDARSRAMTH